MQEPSTIIAGILLLIIIIAALKPLYIWLFDINNLKKNQEEMIKVLKEINEKLEGKNPTQQS